MYAIIIVCVCRSECAYYFSLSWLITWYSHVIQSANDIARLTDVFLASHPLFPVYIAATVSQPLPLQITPPLAYHLPHPLQLILLRRSEVMELECEMSEVHGLLSRLKPDLKYEQVIMLALKLFEKYPPQTLARKCNKLNARSVYAHLNCLQLSNNYLIASSSLIIIIII